MTGPNPAAVHPIPGLAQIAFLKNVVRGPNIEVGDYTYYDDPEGPEEFERKNVLYHYPFLGDRLVIGRFCALARGVRFVMNGANHCMRGPSTYPFQIFGGGWERVMPRLEDLPLKGDTVVGNDVWIGMDALVMPGVRIGDGAIVATQAVVASPVPAYAIVAGNPARVVRRRFPEAEVQALLEVAWWNWDIEKIGRNLEAIVAGDAARLRAAR